jgi:hypothetical protein
MQSSDVKVLPSSVRCPFCTVPPGRRCMTAKDYETATHAARWKAIGILKPSLDDLMADWADRAAYEAKRTEENIQRSLATMRAAELARVAAQVLETDHAQELPVPEQMPRRPQSRAHLTLVVVPPKVR